MNKDIIIHRYEPADYDRLPPSMTQEEWIRKYGIEDSLVPGNHRLIVCYFLTVIIAISLGAIAWVRFAS